VWNTLSLEKLAENQVMMAVRLACSQDIGFLRHKRPALAKDTIHEMIDWLE
jgi:hypothetical protein